MDKFSITFIQNSDVKELYLYSIARMCVECPFKYLHPILNNGNGTYSYSMRFPPMYRISTKNVGNYYPIDRDENVMCDITKYNFGEHGKYNVTINNNTECSVGIIEDPINSYLPILYTLLIYLGLAAAIYVCIYLFKKKSKQPQNVIENGDATTTTKRERLKSLDTFRGISIVLMMFINHGCGGYAIFDHAVWNGLNLGDLVFPWFMWIMGVCIPISLGSLQKKNISKMTTFKNIVRRSCILFAIGLFLSSSIKFKTMRIMGVLQRFGICYFVVGSICLLLQKKNTITDEKSKVHILADIVKLIPHWIIFIVILVIHTVVLFCASDPKCEKGYMGPGGLHDGREHENCTGGITGYIDKIILGDAHIYQSPTLKVVYYGQAFDPEGILGCLTSIFQVFLGIQCGITLMTYKDHTSRLIRWVIWGAVTGLIGGILCNFSEEGGVIPMNKNLWSISFVLVTTSLAYLCLSFSYFIIDFKKLWSGKPFLFAGMNAIIIYIGHNMTYGNFPIHWKFDGYEWLEKHEHFIALVESVWATGLWVFVSYYLYRIKYFFSI